MIRAFFIADLLIAFAYPLDWWTGGVYWKITALIDPRAPDNLVRWYASMQLSLVAFLGAMFVRAKFDWRVWASWLLLALPALFVVLSFEQVGEIHEWLRYRMGHVLPTGFFAKNALYLRDVTILGGLLVTVVLIGVRYSARPDPRREGHIATKYAIGFVLLVGGPSGIEALSPFLSHATPFRVAQLAAEALVELVGITCTLWATRDLFVAHGLSSPLIASPQGDPPA